MTRPSTAWLALAACLASCCCSCATFLTVSSGGRTVYGTAEQGLLRLLWACRDNSSDCTRPKEAKLCLLDRDRWQEWNASLVALTTIQTRTGQRYNYVRHKLAKVFTDCSRTYIPMIEIEPASTPGWRDSTKCDDRSAFFATCGVRVYSDTACMDTRDWYCRINDDLPRDVAAFLSGEVNPTTVDWIPLAAGAGAAAFAGLLLAVGLGLLLWVRAHGRPDCRRPPDGAGDWAPREMVADFLHPDTGESLMVPTPLHEEGR